MTAPTPLVSLRRFLPGRRVERCALCAAPLPEEHSHLLETGARRILCACEACSILFEHRGEARFRRIGRSVRFLKDWAITDSDWDALCIPIGLAFFVQMAEGTRGFYPGPAGCTESLLPISADLLPEMELEIEALLVNRVGGARESYVVPIDRCYQLAGLIRANWRGLAGGEEVWNKINGFFSGLREAAGG